MVHVRMTAWPSLVMMLTLRLLLKMVMMLGRGVDLKLLVMLRHHARILDGPCMSCSC